MAIVNSCVFLNTESKEVSKIIIVRFCTKGTFSDSMDIGVGSKFDAILMKKILNTDPRSVVGRLQERIKGRFFEVAEREIDGVKKSLKSYEGQSDEFGDHNYNFNIYFLSV